MRLRGRLTVCSLLLQRGHNTAGTVDYQARQQIIDIQFTPVYSSEPQTYDEAISSSIKLKYKKTVLYTDASGVPTTGLDPLGVRPATGEAPALPVASSTYDRLSLDPEGLVVNKDGSYYVSDEYGPSIRACPRPLPAAGRSR